GAVVSPEAPILDVPGAVLAERGRIERGRERVTGAVARRVRALRCALVGLERDPVRVLHVPLARLVLNGALPELLEDALHRDPTGGDDGLPALDEDHLGRAV